MNLAHFELGTCRVEDFQLVPGPTLLPRFVSNNLRLCYPHLASQAERTTPMLAEANLRVAV
jgi:hypothetical protein